MIIEKIYAAFVIIIGIAFVYQYGRRLMAESKLHELEEDVESIVKTIDEANSKDRIGGHQIKSPKMTWLQSEFIKMFLEIKSTQKQCKN